MSRIKTLVKRRERKNITSGLSHIPRVFISYRPAKRSILLDRLTLAARRGRPRRISGMNCLRKVNRMDTILKLAELRAAGLRPKQAGTAGHQPKGAGFADRLLIVMDSLVYALIEELKATLEAPSIGEVVRQAVRAYAIELASKGSVEEDVGFPEESYTGTLKKLNIRIPAQTRERLEFLKQRTGVSFTAIIFAGLGILARAADHQERALQTLAQGEAGRDAHDAHPPPRQQRGVLVAADR